MRAPMLVLIGQKLKHLHRRPLGLVVDLARLVSSSTSMERTIRAEVLMTGMISDRLGRDAAQARGP